ncbi:hypothetical protein D3C72_347670 [compost metagenome]
MTKIFSSLALLLSCLAHSQNPNNLLTILDSKKIGLILDVREQLESIKPDDISSLTVYKDPITIKKYGAEFGVIIVTTKKFILDTFYKNNIENSPLKSKIPTAEDLLKIGVVTDHPESKNQPYDELSKYIDTYTLNDKIKKIGSIYFIKPMDSKKINPNWEFGAIEIISEKEMYP